MTLIAKPIIEDKFWVVTDGDVKVGNVVMTNGGYEVKLGSNSGRFDSAESIQRDMRIEFVGLNRPVDKSKPDFAVWPTPDATYNDAYDLRRQLHIFTKTLDSRCNYVAGYFAIRINERWQVLFCPKYIFIQRYEYLGPFMTRKDAAGALKSHSAD
jgi:hypothetical protein